MDVAAWESVRSQTTTASTLTPTKTPKARSRWCVMSSGCRREEFAAITTPRMIQFWPTQISWERKDAIVS